MRFKTFIVAVSVTLLGAALIHAQQKSQPLQPPSATFKISGMTCSACAKTLEAVAKKVAGVSRVAVDYPKSTAEVAYDPLKTTPEEIAKLLTRRSGMKAELAKPAGK